jgi:PIN domain nuclease of toxin-antitoxin system
VKVLLDTHAFLWMSLDAPQLSQRARDLIADMDNELLLSPASYWEIAIKISLGNYELDEPLDEFVNREVERNALDVVPIQPEHASEVARLPFHHRDPFDRMLIAQALVEQVPVLSKDAVFDDYGVRRLW